MGLWSRFRMLFRMRANAALDRVERRGRWSTMPTVSSRSFSGK